MQKIIPHLWFDTQAVEAAEFYVSAFGKGSRVTHKGVIKDTPSGDCDIVSFDLRGFSFMGISAGPHFTLNPTISFMLNFDPSENKDARKDLDALWEKLSDGGKALMPLDKYPFSEHYGWIQDKFGISWQLILTKPEGEPRPFIIPSMMFTGDMTGKAGEAIDFWVSVFKDAPSTSSGQAKRGMTAEYPPGASPEKDAKIMFAEFMLEGQWFTAMDSGHMHTFGFNEAVSLLVQCKDQKEVDYYWEKLSAVPEAEQCGWLKDKYGVSWQINPKAMDDMLKNGSEEQVSRIIKAFLKMKKFDIAALEKAYEEK
jgi:predicted 3-demethylubiquinone-9 3-methyltransferase (glyoxalase superfamily)